MFREIRRFFGGIVGSVVYGAISYYALVTRPGDIHKLSSRVTDIMKHFFPTLDFDKITVRLGASKIVPPSKWGIVIGTTIYLKQSSFEDCNEVDMLRLMHELVHVRQTMDQSWLSSGYAYGADFTEHWNYRDNPKEVEAREFEEENQAELFSMMDDVCVAPRRRENWGWLIWGLGY